MEVQSIAFLNLLNGSFQYRVPLWQRRYCWGSEDIDRLVQDILAIADVRRGQPVHYTGTILTFSEPGPAGTVPVIRLVDGQQRLTTLCILLGCIAAKLDREGPSEY